MMLAPDDPRWSELVASFELAARRLEQAPAYYGDIHGGWLDEWLAGATTPPPTTWWLDNVARTKLDAGATIERIRVHEDPPTPCQQWLRWMSASTVDAGERHHYLTRRVADEAGLGRAGDWWLLDNRLAVVYHSDDQGRRTGVEIVEDAAAISELDRWWRVALDLATNKAT